MKMTGCLKEFIRYSSFNVLGMLGLSCYILADTYFVSRGLGTNGLAALNLAIPVYSFLHGSGLMIGMGGGAKYSIQKSLKTKKDANQTFSNAIMLAAAAAAVFCVLGTFFASPIVFLLGADAEIDQMAVSYLQTVLNFAPAFLLNNVLLCFVRNDGAPQLSMAAMIGGSLANIVLDYVFIFPCDMGMFGAALATGLAPIISIMILSPFFIQRKNGFHFTTWKISGSLTAKIISMGAPSLITEASSGVVMIVFNSIILTFEGNAGVAAYGVIANLSLVVLAVYTGIAQGIQPLLSENYGAGKFSEVKKIFQYAIAAVLIISGIVYGSIFFGAESIAGLFNHDHNALLTDIAVPGLRIYFLACPFAGLNIILSVYFVSIEVARPAHVVSVMRGLAVIIPMAFFLSFLAGTTGIWSSFPVTEFFVSAVGLLLYRLKGPLAVQRFYEPNTVLNAAKKENERAEQGGV